MRFALPVVSTLMMASCLSPSPDSGESVSYERVDLWFQPPQLAGPSTPVATIRTLGELTVPATVGAAPPGRTSAWRQTPPQHLHHRIELRQPALFRFRPLLPSRWPAGCTGSYVVEARDADDPAGGGAEGPGPPRWRQEIEARPARTFAAATQTVDLSELGDGPVVLTWKVRIPPECSSPALFWGEPELLMRAEDRAEDSGDEDGVRIVADGKPPNILLIGADTLRADHLGVYGAEPSLTPSLDRFAATGELWTQMISSFNATNPSFASTLTGRYAQQHGVYDQTTRLSPAEQTLADVLRKIGYKTFCVTSARHLQEARLTQGCRERRETKAQFAGRMAVDHAMEWLEKSASPGVGRPFFAFVHLFDAHTSHTPPEPYASGALPAKDYGLGPVEEWIPFRDRSSGSIEEPRQRHASAELYAGEVAYLDRQVGRLLAYIEQSELDRETIVVFLADHGENLDEHDVRFDHAGLWQTTTHVPLIVRRPGGPAGVRHDVLVQNVDLARWLLEEAGAPMPEPLVGEHLLELTASGGRDYAFSEHAGRRAVSVRDRHYRFTRAASVPGTIDGESLFDLRVDPGELTDVLDQRPEVAARLREALDGWLARGTSADSATSAPEKVDEEVLRQLRALGYVN